MYQEWVLFSDHWNTKFILEKSLLMANLWKFVSMKISCNMVLNISQGFQRIWMFCITLRSVPPTCYVFKIGRCYIASIGFHFEKDFYITFKFGMFCIIQNWKYYIAFPSWTFCVIRNQKHSLLFLFGALTLQVSNYFYSAGPSLSTSQGHLSTQASEQLQQGTQIWCQHITHNMYSCLPH